MAYVQPNSIIQLFKGINLDNRYMHTIYFANESAQNSWFSGKATYTFQQVSYTRYTKNSIKLKADTTDIIDCTYLRFKNDRNVDKWFYAFINSVEYVNENTCLITYEIDVMQTWFIQNGSIRPSFVIREHTNDDTFGINLEEEPCGSDVYDCDFITSAGATGDFGTYWLILETTGSPLRTEWDGNQKSVNQGTFINNGLFNGTSYYTFPTSGQYIQNYQNDLKTILEATMNGSWDEQQRKEDVIDMYTFPARFCHVDKNANKEIVYVQHPQSLDGYTPKNRKLFGYPFSYLQATTGDGDGCIFRWEYFDGDKTQPNRPCEFQEIGTPLGGGQIICYPRDYNGQTENLDCKMVMNEFPKNSYAFDAYEAWMANGGKTKTRNEQIITIVKGVNGVIGSVAQGAAQLAGGVHQYTTTGAGDSPITGLNANTSQSFQTLSQIQSVAMIANAVTGIVGSTTEAIEAGMKVDYKFSDAKYTPNQVVGASTPCITVGHNLLDFYFYSVHVRKDELVRLDDFLSCYGYATNKVKQPNITGRQYWNFVQTRGAVIAGNMPSSSKEAIARIFDGGITFWHNGDNVGNYAISTSQGSINNPIV